MSLGFLEQARNESMARRELSIQSHALLVVRTLDSIYSALQRNPFDGVELDALAAIMYLFDAMLYYADRERQPGMTRKEAELCLVGHLNEAYPGQEEPDYAQVASKIFAAIKDPFRLRYYDFAQRTHSEEQISLLKTPTCIIDYANLIKFRLAGHWSFMAQVTKFPVRRSACHNFLRPNR